MPSKFKQLMEGAKQQMNVEEDYFKPTSSVRTDSMLQEVENFGRVVRSYRQGTLLYSQRLNSFLQAYPSISRRNLPRVWDTMEPGGLPEPQRHDLSEAHPLRIGGDFEEGKWEDSRRVLMRRLNGVMATADAWLTGLEVARARNTRLQAERLQVDSQRRVIHHKLRRLGAHDITLMEVTPPQQAGYEEGGERAGTPVLSSAMGEEGQRRPLTSPDTSPGVSPPRIFTGLQDETSARKGDLARHVMQEQRRLDAVTASYNEQEQLLFEQLRVLAVDSARFKSWVAATLLVCKEGFQGVLYSFGPCKLPLPGFSAARSGGDNGAVGFVDNLVQGIPDIPLDLQAELDEEARLAGASAEDTTPAKGGWQRPPQVMATPPYAAGPYAAGGAPIKGVPAMGGMGEEEILPGEGIAATTGAAERGMRDSEFEVGESEGLASERGGKLGGTAEYRPAGLAGFTEVDAQQDEVLEEEVVPTPIVKPAMQGRSTLVA